MFVCLYYIYIYNIHRWVPKEEPFKIGDRVFQSSTDESLAAVHLERHHEEFGTHPCFKDPKVFFD